MYNFNLYNPTEVFFGTEERGRIGEIVSRYGRRVLIVYGSNRIKENGLLDEIVTLLEASNCTYIELGGVRCNPRNEDVNRGTMLCSGDGIDVILAIGGGSMIDCAKAISVSRFYAGDSWDIITKKVQVNQALPVIALVTVSGTGAEMNNSCVISNGSVKSKRGFTNDLLRPKAAFLDPALTFTVGPFQTACGAVDTLSHVLDTSYVIKSGKMQMLNGIMESLCRTIIHYAPIAVRDPSNYEARANLMWASTWGLNGFLKNGVRQLAACHAIEHELSAYYDIKHGLGMAIVIPRYYEYVLNEENAIIFEEFGKHVFGLREDLAQADAARETINSLKKFMYVDLGLPSALTDLGIDDGTITEMADNLCRGGTLPGVELLTTEDVIQIFKNCL